LLFIHCEEPASAATVALFTIEDAGWPNLEACRPKQALLHLVVLHGNMLSSSYGSFLGDTSVADTAYLGW
jgi:hypothetical protein